MMRYGGYGYGYGGFPFGGMIFMCLLFLVVIALVIYLIIKSSRKGGIIGNTTSSSAINILNERFARGEIDEEQYKRMRDTLEKK